LERTTDAYHQEALITEEGDCSNVEWDSIILIAIPFICLGASLVFQYKVLAMNTTNPKL